MVKCDYTKNQWDCPHFTCIDNEKCCHYRTNNLGTKSCFSYNHQPKLGMVDGQSTRKYKCH